MQIVYKYPFDIQDYFTINMPAGSIVIDVQVQKGVPCVWALVDPEKPEKPRHFRLAGTGHPIDDTILSYGIIGSFQYQTDFVFHLFEILGTEE